MTASRLHSAPSRDTAPWVISCCFHSFPKSVPFTHKRMCLSAYPWWQRSTVGLGAWFPVNQRLKPIWLPSPAAGLLRGRGITCQLQREISSLHITSESASCRVPPNPCVPFLTLVNIFPDQGLWQGQGSFQASMWKICSCLCRELYLAWHKYKCIKDGAGLMIFRFAL